MSTPTDSRPSRHILLDVAFWLILVILVALPVVTSITLCSGALSSKMDTLACAGVTSALAVFLVCIGTIYATLGSRDAPAACILINLAGIVLGWPISNVREYSSFVDGYYYNSLHKSVTTSAIWPLYSLCYCLRNTIPCPCGEGSESSGSGEIHHSAPAAAERVAPSR